ncbi:MAG: flavin reductase family protein [Desulfobacterales bacterium]|uniref:Flavin reductase family protein n=1 Tax=Candidatus Desulfatibia vada TaxID=2841696 RepID=A0A8J6NTM7_9BACT|nr:flavin reductase family protein [Candidatus Desulfatibia vada]MBL6971537.1 flavin reductase family protein [Desulfobacterales bacterium]MBL7218449.1 flavin reductase family protein [Desulfobacteraceae bacterium]
MEISPANSSSLEIYKILIGAILPRPIAWVSTLDASGNMNLAPFSFFTVASVNPPILCFSPLLLENSKEKDTLVNIKQTGEFVVNVVSRGLAQKMNQTSAPYPPGVNEFVAADVAAQQSTVVKPPRVADSPISFECKLHQIISLGSEPRAGNLILGKICNIHIHPEIFRNGKLDSESLDNIGRLWGDMYSTIRDCFEMKRPEI